MIVLTKSSLSNLFYTIIKKIMSFDTPDNNTSSQVEHKSEEVKDSLIAANAQIIEETKNTVATEEKLDKQNPNDRN